MATLSGARGGKALLLTTAVMMALPTLIPNAAVAQDLTDNAKYAGIVVDAQTGEVLYGMRADAERYPASLTKIMTLYMVFDALAHGQIKPTDQITISQHAASQAPVKVYMKAGDTIDVDTAMRLASTYSANDMAVALAEKVGGTEERFAAMMTIKAQELGMTETRFVNANGLPDSRQVTSARDLAILARAVMRDYPQYYGYFNLPSVTFRGRTYYNHNPLHGMPGVDGMKTGFTNAAGETIVVSQVKYGHRLIAVMLGATNSRQRREHATELLNIGFDVENRRDHGEVITVAQNEFTKAFDTGIMPSSTTPYQVMPQGPVPYTVLAANSKPLSDQQLRATLEGSEQANATDSDVEKASAVIKAPDVVAALNQTPKAADLTPAPVQKATPAPVTRTAEKIRVHTRLAAADSKASKSRKKKRDAVWSIQVGAFRDKELAADWVKKIQHRFDDALAEGRSQVTKSDAGWYRTRFAALTKEEAQGACKSMSAKHLDCMVIKPDA
ncbi:serine hydrolase [Asticcacaulis sp. EMRT-3]|uniref:serine hydrolase n=1 Tax=Asticcacaulis sp. EMRT-3 TaxID=3040349 RepID=UPI0024AF0ADD|nr:serine hydrolase [Asticcacaulis sp. EMRT-3]MDI7774212.1 SPOR domain-containing protein [Asticcacaulis sp. EMRT-3]